MDRFHLGAYVRKRSGAFWEGSVVGHYTTAQTPDGIAVQLFGWIDGPVQIYPAAALELCDHSNSRLPPPPSSRDRVSIAAKAMADSIGHGMREKCLEHAKAVVVALDQTPPPSTHVAVEDEIARVVQSVNEWDDRTSPDDYPEHLLITSEELADILRNFAETLSTSEASR